LESAIAHRTRLVLHRQSLSVSCLFANVVHKRAASTDRTVEHKDEQDLEPVLDCSASVGNNALFLALQGVCCIHFGVGLTDASFAEFCVQQRNVTDLVEFWTPHQRTGHFDSNRRANSAPWG